MTVRNDAEARIRELTDQFVSELSVVIHEAALSAVQDAIEDISGTTAPRRKKRGKKAGRKKASRKKTGKKRGRRGKRIRRSPDDVAAMERSILDQVSRNPGCGATELSEALGVETKDLRLPIKNLIAAKKLKTKGQRRGTKYFTGKR